MERTDVTPPASVPPVARLACGLRISQARYAIAKLDVADRLGGGPLTSDELALAVDAHPGALRRTLRAHPSARITQRRVPGRQMDMKSDRKPSRRASDGAAPTRQHRI